MAISVTADPIEISLSIKHLLSQYPEADRNTELDQVFYCNYTDVHGVEDAGIPEVEVSITGTWLNICIAVDPIEITLTQHGTYPSSFLVDSSAISIEVTIPTGSSDIILENLKSNWVAWSQIGEMNFTIGRDNVAGERPMDWKGWAYSVKKLGSKVVVYGENGVSLLTPSNVNWSMNTIYRVGLLSKNAVCGDDKVHFFIDNKYQLFVLSEGLEKHDYSEYLSVLTNPVMSYDIESGLVYICDGIYGFVFSLADKSLGTGPVNITGISSQDGTLYVAAPNTISKPVFEICTDIYDLGSRSTKTIVSIEFGTDLSENLYASIDHRMNISDSFTQTPWYEVSGRGEVWITTFGREFRFRLKNLAYESFALDYIKINAVKHAN